MKCKKRYKENGNKADSIGKRLAILMFLLTWLVLGLAFPTLARLNPGDILVVDPSAGTGGNGALFRVDPVSGERTVLSDFGDATMGPDRTYPV